MSGNAVHVWGRGGICQRCGKPLKQIPISECSLEAYKQSEPRLGQHVFVYRHIDSEAGELTDYPPDCLTPAKSNA